MQHSRLFKKKKFHRRKPKLTLLIEHQSVRGRCETIALKYLCPDPVGPDPIGPDPIGPDPIGPDPIGN